MSIDTYTTSAMADEFNARLAGGRIQDTVQIDRETFGLEVYANRERQYLLLSGDNQRPVAFIAGEKLRRGVQNPTPLGLFFRNRVEGMILQKVEQPPWERILIFELSGPDSTLKIILEMIERRANLILVQEDTILECARRVGPEDNRHRTILPRQPYVMPPPQTADQIAPDKINPTKLAAILQRDPTQKAWLALVRGVLGFSPLLAKEAMYLAHQNVNLKAADANPYTVDAALKTFLPRILRGEWRPGVALDDYGVVKAPVAYPVTHTGDWQDVSSISEAVEKYSGVLEDGGAYEAAREPIRKQIEGARDKLNGKMFSLQRSLKDESEIEVLKQSGELLLAYQYTMEEGQTELIAQYEVEGEPLVIKVDPELTPLENAQAYFTKYEKSKRARKQLPKRIAETQSELDFLDQLEADLDMAENWQDIGEVQEALQKNGYWRGKRYQIPRGGRSGPFRVVTDDGFVIFIGRNARQNEDVTFNRSDPYDLWLHARDVPGAHVIIKTDARKVPESVLLEAASYAAYYSKNRASTRAEVMVAERRHVRKIKGGHPGQVRVFEERGSLNVVPRKAEK